MKRVIFNQKGGVGKTSITCNLAAAMSKRGKRVLVVDLDAQTNASHYLMNKFDSDSYANIYDFFSSTLKLKFGKETLASVTHKSDYDNLWIVPSSSRLFELQNKLESRYKIFKLLHAIDELVEEMEFDEVLFDTPPALNFFTMSALIASDKVLVPFDCDAFSADALHKVLDVVEDISEDHKPELEVEGVIVNQFQAQAKLPMATIELLMSQGFNILSPYLSSSIVMRESHGLQKPLVYFRPKHKLSKEYDGLAENLIGLNVKKKAKKQKIRNELDI